MSWLPQSLAAPARFAGLALAGALLAAVPARADIIKFSALMRGVTMTQAQCSELPQAVWITAAGKSFCMRYYLSTAGGTGDRPVVMLQGDQIGRFDPRTQQFEIAPEAKTEDTDTDNLMKLADAMSRRFKGPAIYLARVGLDGSSGFHAIRHSMLELYATNQALEAIKRRHRFAGFHLIGQSGGATLVGGLLGLRNDIGCAVPGSGNLVQVGNVKRPDSPAAWIDPAAMAPAIVKTSSARILVVTDPRDQVVPAERQSSFVTRLRDAGGSAEQFFVEATDDRHHGVTLYAIYATDACIRGASNEQIARGLASYVKARVASSRPNAKPDAEPDAKIDRAREPGPTGVAASEQSRIEASARKASDVMPPRS
jgi:hypothetical protein